MFDIKNESLGFVQFFGELVIVPFIYTIPVKYLVDHPYKLHPLNGAIFVALTGKLNAFKFYLSGGTTIKTWKTISRNYHYIVCGS